MTNEVIMYLEPEEDLVNVYDRLEKTKARSIILVIPPQTQLSHLREWLLLFKRVRELDQNVLVISSDEQIRNVAYSAGFRVAESLESAPFAGPQSIYNPIRSNKNGKTSKSANRQGNKASRSLQSGRQQKPSSSNKGNYTLDGSENMRRASDTYVSSTYEVEELRNDSDYDIPMETVPPPQPGVRESEDDEVDPEKRSLDEDYYVARSIEQAAQSPQSSQLSSTIENTKTSRSKFEQSSKIPQPGEIDDDPLGHMEDIQPIPIREQRASTIIHDVDQDVNDISDEPIDVYEPEELKIEDLGEGEEGMLPDDWPSHTADDQVPEASVDQAMLPMDRMSTRSSRKGNTKRPPLDDILVNDALIAASSSTGGQTRSRTPSPTARREPKPIIQPPQQQRKVNTNPTTQQKNVPVSTKSSHKQTRSNSKRNGKRILAIASISLGVLLLALVLFAFLGSNATVTVVVPAQTPTVPKQYGASMNPQSGRPNTIPSQVLTYTATARGQGTVTGTTKQGNQVASGTVTFTNTGSTPLDIPTGTVLSTSGATPVQFVTIADVFVLAGASNAIPSPVQAQLAGDSGNVASNSITIIPPDSLTKIAQSNPRVTPPTPQTLTVTNPNPMTGGGAANVQSVTSTDAKTLAASLQPQIQNEVNAWLKNVVHPGDVAGTPVPNVLTSATPLPGETIITTPAIGQPAPGGKFSGILTAKVSLLVIRKATIQAAGEAQLTAYASHMTPPTTVATSKPVTVKVTKSTPSQDGKSLTVILSATGYVVQQVLLQPLSQKLAGMSVDQAKSYINSGQAGITGVVTTNLALFSPFPGHMPFRSDQIHIVLLPGPIKGATNG